MPSSNMDMLNNFIKRYTYAMNRLNDPKNDLGVKETLLKLVKRYFNGDVSAFANWYHSYNGKPRHAKQIPYDRIMTANEARTVYDWDYRRVRKELAKLPEDRLHGILTHGTPTKNDVPSLKLFKQRNFYKKELHHDRESLADLKKNFEPNEWCTTRDGFINKLTPMDVTIIKLNLQYPHKNLLGRYVIANLNRIIDNYKHHRPLVWA